jgi:FixJ family two-component response regulator
VRFSGRIGVVTDISMLFVIEDGADLGPSIQGLLKAARLRSESFEKPEQFLNEKASRRS